MKGYEQSCTFSLNLGFESDVSSSNLDEWRNLDEWSAIAPALT